MHSRVFWCAEHIATAADGCQRGYADIAGFYRVSLEFTKDGLAVYVNILWPTCLDLL
jgi:hypothetical protein